MRVIPYNRCVTGLGGKTPQEFLQLVSTVFRIIEHDSGNRILGWEHCERAGCERAGCSEAPSLSAAPDWPILTSLSIPQADSFLFSFASPEKNAVRGPEFAPESDSGSETSSEVDGSEESDMNATYGDLSRSCSATELGSEITRHVHVAALSELGLASGCKANNVTAPGSRSAQLVPFERERERENEKRCVPPTLSHTIAMYFEGRWLDLIPLEVVEEKDGDPLGSLDVQVRPLALRTRSRTKCPRLTTHRGPLDSAPALYALCPL